MSNFSDSTIPPARRGFWERQLHPTAAERRRLRRGQTWLAIVGAYVLLLFAHLWAPDWRNPSPWYVTISWCAFIIRVFQFHLGLLVAAVAAIALWGRQRRAALVALPLLTFTLGPPLRSLLPRTPAPAAPSDLAVVSCNLLMINQQTRDMADQLAETDADVILLQEYTDHWHEAFQQRLGQRYPHVVYFPRDDSFGAAIYSQHPFVEKPTKFLGIGIFDDPQMRAVIEFGGQKVALYNLHLRPPWGGRAYVIEHQLQFAALLDLLRQERLPAVVGGDFNFNETTAYASAMGVQGFHDAYDQAGWGRGATWPKLGLLRWAPGLRLDHIYLSTSLRCTAARTLAPCGSDHRALLAKIHVAPAPPSTVDDSATSR